MTKKLIPFSRELYEQGYKAYTRDGRKVVSLHFDESGSSNPHKVMFISRGANGDLRVASSDLNGIYISSMECDHDLMLEAKTMDLWIGIKRRSDGSIYTSDAVRNEKYVAEKNWDSIVKITLDAGTLEQVIDNGYLNTNLIAPGNCT